MLPLTAHKYHPLTLALGADLACPFPDDRANEEPRSWRFELLLNLCILCRSVADIRQVDKNGGGRGEEGQ